MDITNILHKISYFKWVFIIWINGLLIYTFLFDYQNHLENTGTMIFLSGIYLGLESLSDMKKAPKKELLKYREEAYVRRLCIMLFIVSGSISLISLFFIFVEIFFRGINDYYEAAFNDLGLSCLAMLLGFLCLIKAVKDKAEYAQSEKYITLVPEPHAMEQ